MKSNNTKLLEKLNTNFSHTPNNDQKKAIHELVEFITTLGNRSVFVLKGYAGTGKTTLISSLVKSLPSIGKRSVLMAPTGRAAKVLSKYSNKKSSTIHKKIYWIKRNKKGNTYVSLKENTHTNTIFIVDEASMIAEEIKDSIGNRSLLKDLIEYVYEGIDCKLILIGDTAQLPPVNLDLSPALNEDLLEMNYSKQAIAIELKTVVRQSKKSTILKNATHIRNLIEKNIIDFPKIQLDNEVIKIESREELQEYIETAYAKSEIENTTIICKSNKRANQYNEKIRSEILWQENIISAGDIMMIVRNNYYWLNDEHQAGFLANGDLIEILKVYDIKKIYGFTFAKTSIRLLDYPDENDIDLLLLLDTINSDSPSLKYDEYKKLYNEVALDYKGEKEINKKIKEDQYFNAVQIKFAYSITCHKSQGGQWEEVFIDQGYFKEEFLSKNYLRWLYTATTRATKKLYLINFDDRFFK